MNDEDPEYAGFWRRAAAYAIDTALISICMAQLQNYFWNSMAASSAQLGQDTMLRLVTLVTSAWSILTGWGYFAGMECSPLQATVGKLAVGLYVTDLDRNRLSIGKATGRYLAKVISAVILGIGFFMAGWNENKQALHDMVAGTLVWTK
jgi:uncharacterized RDD family membrane protein YckC